MVQLIEDAKSIETESFGTLNTASSGTKLLPDQTPNASNVWVDEIPGSVITANGYVKVGECPSGSPATLLINYFKTSDGTQTFIISDNETVWKTTDFSTFDVLATGLAVGFQLRALIIRDKAWFTNGSDPVFTFDGTSVVTLDGSGGRPDVPRGRYIAYQDERVWLFHIVGDRSKCAFSSLTDTSGNIITPDDVNAWVDANYLQINEGDADFGTSLFVYRGRLYAGKQYTIWRIEGYDEFTYTRVKTRASTGTRFNESVQELDGVIHFIGVDGFYVFNGEETQRISDLINSGEFGFEGLQQPFLNNHFQTVTTTEEFNDGTYAVTVAERNKLLDPSNDKLTLIAADDGQADYANGALLHNLDINRSIGNIVLAQIDDTSENTNIGPGLTSFFAVSDPRVTYFGNGQMMNDGDLSGRCGIAYGTFANNDILAFHVAVNGHYINKIIVRSLEVSSFLSNGQPGSDPQSRLNAHRIEANVGSYEPPGQFNGTWITVADFPISQPHSLTPTQYGDMTITFPALHCQQIRIYTNVFNMKITMTEIDVYRAGYAPEGKFISQGVDYTEAPSAFGALIADVTLNDQGLTFFTQSSDDNSTWDSEVPVVLGDDIGSTPRRYLRWGANLFSFNESESPTISAVYVKGMYISEKFDAGSNIFSWGPYEVNQSQNGGQILHFYRNSATQVGLDSEAWIPVVPGAIINADVADEWIQFKIEVATGSRNSFPLITDVTINWIEGDADQVQTLQNIGSIVWRNRYWLTAAKKRSQFNDINLIRGKKTFTSPWQRKGWPLLAFGIFQGNLYASRSDNPDILRLDIGNSEDGSDLDSFYESKDFEFDGFQANIFEALVSMDRMGPWTASFGLSVDGGVTYTEKTIDLTVLDDEPVRFEKQLHFSIRNAGQVRWRIRSNGVDQPFRLHNVKLIYKILPARGTLV